MNVVAEQLVCLPILCLKRVLCGGARHQGISSLHCENYSDQNVMIINQATKDPYPCYRNTHIIQTMMLCVSEIRRALQ
jgi:hypothetical protein